MGVGWEERGPARNKMIPGHLVAPPSLMDRLELMAQNLGSLLSAS